MKRSSSEKKSVGASAPNVEARQASSMRQTFRKDPTHIVHGLAVEKTQEAILYRMFQAHKASVTSAVFVYDDETKQILVTASVDGTVVYWDLEHLALHKSRLESSRISSKYPVLSLAVDSDRAKDGALSVYCARAKENDILLWDQPPNNGFNPRVKLNGQSGWIRDLKSNGRWMFSADCNNLRQWDLSWAMPKHVQDVSLFKGDILTVACAKDKVFTGLSDGSIHCWKISKNGQLTYATSCQAHEDRVNAIVWDSEVLYSAGSDGNLKSWNANSLERIATYNNAHEGEKINCLTVGPDGVVYSGGNDGGLIRRWNGKLLLPCQQPLFGHNNPIRVLSFGTLNSLVSGDSSGVVSIWRV